MIDYSEVLLTLKQGKRRLADLLTKRQYKLAIDMVDDLIIALIDLKWWLRKQVEDNK